MASFDIKSVVITPAVAEVRQDCVVLTLESDEAQVLADILCRIGGGRLTRRSIADEIATALSEAGVDGNTSATDIDSIKNRAIYFK